MARYDRGAGRGYSGRSIASGYGADFGDWGDRWGSGPPAGFRGRGAGPYGGRGAPLEAGRYGGAYTGRYDRGAFGGPYPAYGGYPGSARTGMHYGGYDAQYERDTFVPEEAYRRHPRFDRPPRQVSGRWPEAEHGYDLSMGMDDRYIEQSVRENLYGDTWIDPDRIDVRVQDGVVTLTGEVDDYMEARYAWDDAWESVGVRGVLNQLAVRTDRPSQDEGEPMMQTEGRKSR